MSTGGFLSPDQILSLQIRLDTSGLRQEAEAAGGQIAAGVKDRAGTIDLSKAIKFDPDSPAARQAKSGIERVLSGVDVRPITKPFGTAFGQEAVVGLRAFQQEADKAGEKVSDIGEKAARAAEMAEARFTRIGPALQALAAGIAGGGIAEFSEGIAGIGEAAEGAGGSLATLAKTTGLVATGFGAGVLAVKAFDDETTHLAQEGEQVALSFQKMASLTGQTAEQWQALKTLMTGSGVDAETMGRAFLNLSLHVREAMTTMQQELANEADQSADAARAVTESDRKIIDTKRELVDATENAREAQAKANVEGKFVGQEQQLQARQLEQYGPEGAHISAREAAINYELMRRSFGLAPTGASNEQLEQEKNRLRLEGARLQVDEARDRETSANIKGEQAFEFQARGLSPTGGPGPEEAVAKLGRNSDEATEKVLKLGDALEKAFQDAGKAERDQAQLRFTTTRSVAGLIQTGDAAALQNVQQPALRRALTLIGSEQFGGGARGAMEALGQFVRQAVPKGQEEGTPGADVAQQMMFSLFGIRPTAAQPSANLFGFLRQLTPGRFDEVVKSPENVETAKLFKDSFPEFDRLRQAELDTKEQQERIDVVRGVQRVPQAIDNIRDWADLTNIAKSGIQDLGTAAEGAAKKLVEFSGHLVSPGPGALTPQGDNQRSIAQRLSAGETQGQVFGPAPAGPNSIGQLTQAMSDLAVRQRSVESSTMAPAAKQAALDQIQAEAERLRQEIDVLSGDVQSGGAKVGQSLDAAAGSIDAARQKIDQAPSAPAGKATGGLISGPGTETSDSIPARLSLGEYVVRAHSVRGVGVPFLDAINEGRLSLGGVVRMATGGFGFDAAKALNYQSNLLDAMLNPEHKGTPPPPSDPIWAKVYQIMPTKNAYWETKKGRGWRWGAHPLVPGVLPHSDASSYAGMLYSTIKGQIADGQRKGEGAGLGPGGEASVGHGPGPGSSDSSGDAMIAGAGPMTADWTGPATAPEGAAARAAAAAEEAGGERHLVDPYRERSSPRDLPSGDKQYMVDPYRERFAPRDLPSGNKQYMVDPYRERFAPQFPAADWKGPATAPEGAAARAAAARMASPGAPPASQEPREGVSQPPMAPEATAVPPDAATKAAMDWRAEQDRRDRLETGFQPRVDLGYPGFKIKANEPRPGPELKIKVNEPLGLAIHPTSAADAIDRTTVDERPARTADERPARSPDVVAVPSPIPPPAALRTIDEMGPGYFSPTARVPGLSDRLERAPSPAPAPPRGDIIDRTVGANFGLRDIPRRIVSGWRNILGVDDEKKKDVVDNYADGGQVPDFSEAGPPPPDFSEATPLPPRGAADLILAEDVRRAARGDPSRIASVLWDKSIKTAAESQSLPSAGDGHMPKDSSNILRIAQMLKGMQAEEGMAEGGQIRVGDFESSGKHPDHLAAWRVGLAEGGDGVRSLRAIRRFEAAADGGSIRGPGTETSDTIPAMLSNGEFVVRAAAVRRVGLPMLDRINAAAGGSMDFESSGKHPDHLAAWRPIFSMARGGPVPYRTGPISGVPGRGVPLPDVPPQEIALASAFRDQAASAFKEVQSAVRGVGYSNVSSHSEELQQIADGIGKSLLPSLAEVGGAAVPEAVGSGGTASTESHSLDLRTDAGNFSVWADNKTIEALRLSALNDKLQSTGIRPTWFS